MYLCNILRSYTQASYWLAAFQVVYATEFLCLSVAKLLVLHRIADFAAPKGVGLSRRLVVGGRAVMAAVVVGNVVGLCGNIASAVLFEQTGDLEADAAAAYAANNTAAIKVIVAEAFHRATVASSAGSVQKISEVTALLIIILAFAVVGIAGARRLSSALHHMNDAQGAFGRQILRQIVGTTAFVFVTFLLRALFSTMNALASALTVYEAGCNAGNCDPACHNVWQLILYWLEFTPEFQLSVVLISSPFAMLVALWGMTSDRTLQAMQSNSLSERLQMVTVGPKDSVLAVSVRESLQASSRS